MENQASTSYTDRLNEVINLETYKLRIKEIESEKTLVSKNIEMANKNIIKYKDISAIIFDLAAYGSTLYEILEPLERGELANLVFNSITVVNGELNLSPLPYFSEIRDLIVEINSSKMLKSKELASKIFELSDNDINKQELNNLTYECSTIRRDGDSNSGQDFSCYGFSKPAPSATWVPLPKTHY